MAVKCCSKRSVKLRKASYAKAIKAANARDGRFSSKASKKKATSKVAPPKKAKSCRACGKA